jgi:EAL domain-containing protein (putative c-di-GMP-specific phosphodiesterase class I)
VENEKQMDLLVVRHCNEIQGCMFSRTVPVVASSQLVRQSQGAWEGAQQEDLLMHERHRN